jgi:DNA-binding YbaB/EbfC family protein
MIGDLYSKLKEARARIEETKKRLNDIIVETSVEDGAIKVKANANKVITSIDITEEFFQKADKEGLEDLLLSAINIALEEAAQKGEIEMKEITKGMLPNFPGLV